jgi:hypothetical protein
MARTAVVAGTATAVSNNVSRRQARRWGQQDAAEQVPQQQYYEQPPAYQQPEVDPTAAQLQQLAELQRQGIITPEEFAAKKKQVLGI